MNGSLVHLDECGIDWHIIMDWGPFWMGANASNRIIRIHLPQYWSELTLDCKNAAEAENCFLDDFPVGVEHEVLHILMGGWLPIEVEHRMIEHLTGVDSFGRKIADADISWVTRY